MTSQEKSKALDLLKSPEMHSSFRAGHFSSSPTEFQNLNNLFKFNLSFTINSQIYFRTENELNGRVPFKTGSRNFEKNCSHHDSRSDRSAKGSPRVHKTSVGREILANFTSLAARRRPFGSSLCRYSIDSKVARPIKRDLRPPKILNWENI